MKNKKNISEVNLTQKRCWCGESKLIESYSGTWFGKSPIKFSIGKCTKCGTMRTTYVEKPKVDYDEEDIYKVLSPRHYNALKIIKQYVIPGNILDIGCSKGDVLDWLKSNCWNLNEFHGIDLNKKAIKLANDKNLKVGKIQDVKGKYSNIILMHTLEHVPNLKKFFKEIQRISQPKTRLHIFVPNINSYNAKRNIYRWGALNPSQHVWHHTKESLVKIIQHFLPNSKIIHLSDSWIWSPRKIIRIVADNFLEKDQIELVVEI